MKNKIVRSQIAGCYKLINYADKLLEKHINLSDDVNKSFYVCFKGFINSANDYIFSVFQDVQNEKNGVILYTKSNANRAYIRNCLESTLLLYIFEQHPEYCEKFMLTFPSDTKRISSLFTGVTTDEKFLKRFAWLPRIKGKRINNLNDLLNYIDFDNEEQKTFYKILIRNIDNFTHPSFNISESIENYSIINDNLILTLFAKDGLLSQLNESFIESFIDFFEDKLSIDEKEMLKSKLGLLETSNELDLYYLKTIKSIPVDFRSISYIVALIPNYILAYKNIPYKNKNVGYLLQDLSTHYDDLLKSYFAKDITIFYTKARHVLESLSLLHILLKEEEDRSVVFYIHQNIKGYESKKTSSVLLKEFDSSFNEEKLDIIYERNIENIHNYYLKVHNKDVERGKILRLNGWALYLKDINNETVYNAPDILAYLTNDIFKNNKQITDFILGVFEESNAFMHITPYAIFNEDFTRCYDTFLYINSLLIQIIYGTLSVFNLKEVIDEKTANEINTLFFSAILKLNDYIKNSQNSTK